MPFDPLTYQPPPMPDRSPRRMNPRGETIVLRLVFFWLFLMFALPFSAGTFIDMIRYVEQR